MVFSLTYSSQARRPFDDEALLRLEQQAASNNEQSGISGYLYYRDRLFLQYLEGDEETVTKLMTTITADPRHDILVATPLAPHPQRVFPHWYMRFLSADLNTQSQTLEDELVFILEQSALPENNSEEIGAAIHHITQRISALDW